MNAQKGSAVSKHKGSVQMAKKPWAVTQHEAVDIVLGPLVSTSLRAGTSVELAPAQTMKTIPGTYRFATKRDADRFCSERRAAAGNPGVCSEPFRN